MDESRIWTRTEFDLHFGPPVSLRVFAITKLPRSEIAVALKLQLDVYIQKISLSPCLNHLVIVRSDGLVYVVENIDHRLSGARTDIHCLKTDELVVEGPMVIHGRRMFLNTFSHFSGIFAITVNWPNSKYISPTQPDLYTDSQLFCSCLEIIPGRDQPATMDFRASHTGFWLTWDCWDINTPPYQTTVVASLDFSGMMQNVGREAAIVVLDSDDADDF